MTKYEADIDKVEKFADDTFEVLIKEKWSLDECVLLVRVLNENVAGAIDAARRFPISKEHVVVGKKIVEEVVVEQSKQRMAAAQQQSAAVPRGGS